MGIKTKEKNQDVHTHARIYTQVLANPEFYNLSSQLLDFTL